MFGCGFSQTLDCQHVINSRWATWFGLPVSLGGVAVYGMILAASLLVGRRVSDRWKRLGWAALLLLTTAAAGSAVWFIYVQWFVMGSHCLWCMVVHTCGLLLVAGVIVFGPVRIGRAATDDSIALLRQSLASERDAIEPALGRRALVTTPTTAWLLAGGFLATIALIVGQQFTSQGMVVEMAETPGNDQPTVQLGKDNTALDESSIARPAVSTMDGAMDSQLPSGIENAADSPGAADLDEPNIAQPPASEPVPADPSPVNPPPIESPPADASGEHSASPPAGAVEELLGDPIPPAIEPVDASIDEPAAASSDTSSGDEAPPPSESPGAVDVPPAAAPLEPLRWDRKLAVYNGSDELDLDEHIVTGKIGAPFVIVTLFDYTCSHCRGMHSVMEMLRGRYGDQLAFVHIPAPLNTSCNPHITSTHKAHRDACYLARLALAVWRVKPSAFAAYHDWLFEWPRTREQARAQAVQVIGGEALNDALVDIWVGRHLRRCVQLHHASGGTGLPVTLVGGRTAKGHESSPRATFETLSRLLESELGIAPLGTPSAAP
jgi:uncharacterized membrane protein